MVLPKHCNSGFSSCPQKALKNSDDWWLWIPTVTGFGQDLMYINIYIYIYVSIKYSFSHNHGSMEKLLYLKGNYYWRYTNFSLNHDYGRTCIWRMISYSTYGSTLLASIHQETGHGKVWRQQAPPGNHGVCQIWGNKCGTSVNVTILGYTPEV